MTEEKTKECCEDKFRYKYIHKHWHKSSGNGAVYGLGFVGALIYFLGNATSFSEGLLGILKAIVWPAMLVYRLFTLLNL